MTQAGPIARFEDIEAWRKARILTSRVCRITGTGPFSRDFGLRDQIRRSAVSVMANIAEGFERAEDRGFRQFLSIAKGSVAEVKPHLYVALDAEFLTEEQFQDLYALAEQTGRLIAGFVRYLARSEIRGLKYKDAR